MDPRGSRPVLDRIKRTYRSTLRDRRLEAGLSQKDLSRQSGVAGSRICAIEKGRSLPSAAYIIAFAEILGCKLDDLFVRVDADEEEGG